MHLHEIGSRWQILPDTPQSAPLVLVGFVFIGRWVILEIGHTKASLVGCGWADVGAAEIGFLACRAVANFLVEPGKSSVSQTQAAGM